MAAGTNDAQAVRNAPTRSVPASSPATARSSVSAVAGRAEDRARVGVEALARRREPDRPAAAFDQGHAELALELRDVMRDHRLRVVELERGGRERALVGHCTEDGEAPQVQHR